jgi:hypothetical protein
MPGGWFGAGAMPKERERSLGMRGDVVKRKKRGGKTWGIYAKVD